VTTETPTEHTVQLVKQQQQQQRQQQQQQQFSF